jgi:hypothetical protein
MNVARKKRAEGPKEKIGVQLVDDYALRWRALCDKLRRKDGELAKWILEEFIEKGAEDYLKTHATVFGSGPHRSLPDQRLRVIPPTASAGGESSASNVVGFASNVDKPQPLHETAMDICLYAAAGKDRHPEPFPTGETVMVYNPTAREAQRNGWVIVKVVGESMEPDFPNGTPIFIKPIEPDQVRDGDTVLVLHEGQQMLKWITFKRVRKRLTNVVLKSLNDKDIPVADDDDSFRIIGEQVGFVGGRRNYRSLLPQPDDKKGH